MATNPFAKKLKKDKPVQSKNKMKEMIEKSRQKTNTFDLFNDDSFEKENADESIVSSIFDQMKKKSNADDQLVEQMGLITKQKKGEDLIEHDDLGEIDHQEGNKDDLIEHDDLGKIDSQEEADVEGRFEEEDMKSQENREEPENEQESCKNEEQGGKDDSQEEKQEKSQEDLENDKEEENVSYHSEKEEEIDQKSNSEQKIEDSPSEESEEEIVKVSKEAENLPENLKKTESMNKFSSAQRDPYSPAQSPLMTGKQASSFSPEEEDKGLSDSLIDNIESPDSNKEKAPTGLKLDLKSLPKNENDFSFTERDDKKSDTNQNISQETKSVYFNNEEEAPKNKLKYLAPVVNYFETPQRPKTVVNSGQYSARFKHEANRTDCITQAINSQRRQSRLKELKIRNDSFSLCSPKKSKNIYFEQNEIILLKNELNTLKSLNKRLTEENIDLKVKLHAPEDQKFKLQLQRKDQKIANLKQENENLSKEIESLEQSISLLNEQIDDSILSSLDFRRGVKDKMVKIENLYKEGYFKGVKHSVFEVEQSNLSISGVKKTVSQSTLKVENDDLTAKLRNIPKPKVPKKNPFGQKKEEKQEKTAVDLFGEKKEEKPKTGNTLFEVKNQDKPKKINKDLFGDKQSEKKPKKKNPFGGAEINANDLFNRQEENELFGDSIVKLGNNDSFVSNKTTPLQLNEAFKKQDAQSIFDQPSQTDIFGSNKPKKRGKLANKNPFQ